MPLIRSPVAMRSINTLAIPILLPCILTSLGCGVEQRIPVGRDTVDSFGDGTYQVLRSPDRKVLFNCEHQRTILDDVKAWRRSGDDVYARGAYGQMVVLNVVSGREKSSRNLKDFSAKEQAILESLAK